MNISLKLTNLTNKKIVILRKDEKIYLMKGYDFNDELAKFA